MRSPTIGKHQLDRPTSPKSANETLPKLKTVKKFSETRNDLMGPSMAELKLPKNISGLEILV